MPELNGTEWDQFLAHYPDAHLLQTRAWGELKAAFGWEVTWVQVDSLAGPLGAQLLFRKLPAGLRLAYIAKGPVGPPGAQWSALWPAVDAVCRQRRAVLLKLEPDLWQDAGQADALPPGFVASPHSVQPPRTIVIDLDGSEDEILARMKQKTRYNVRLAGRKGVVVEPSSDLDRFYELMKVTGGRDDFGIHSLNYYRQAYERFHPQGDCELLVACAEGVWLAALMVFAHGRRAWYLYGASADEGREKMPTYLLQWEAMRWARARGCQEYDLWGVPDQEEAVLEEQFTQRKDGLWGVYRFKRGFGGQLRRSRGPWDRVYQPLAYRLYRWWAGRRGEANNAG